MSGVPRFEGYGVPAAPQPRSEYTPPETRASTTTLVGFIVQCDLCPQKAVVSEQPEIGWVCPRCADVIGPERAYLTKMLSGRLCHEDEVDCTEGGCPNPDYCLRKVQG